MCTVAIRLHLEMGTGAPPLPPAVRWRTAAGRRLIASALLFCSLGLLAAAESLHPIPGTAIHVATPADWVVAMPRAGAVLILRSPAVAGPVAPGDETVAAAGERTRAAIAVVLRPLPGPSAAEAFARASFADLQRLAPDWVEIETPAATTIHGRTWWRVRYRFRTGQLAWEQLAIAGVLPGAETLGLCLTCSTEGARFTEWLPAFEAAIASLGRPAGQ